MDLCEIHLCEDTAPLWLCSVEFSYGRFITAIVRFGKDAVPKRVQIFVTDFFHRIHRAFSLVSVFWMRQVLTGTQRRDLSPVSELVQRECSWIFALDTSHKGAFFLRFLLGGELGYYSLQQTTEKEIRLCIVRRARSLPVFQRIVDTTPDVRRLTSI